MRATAAAHCCRAKLRKDAKVREVYKFGKTLGTGGELCLLIDTPFLMKSFVV